MISSDFVVMYFSFCVMVISTIISAGEHQLRSIADQFQALEKLKNVPSEATFKGKVIKSHFYKVDHLSNCTLDGKLFVVSRSPS